MNRINVRNKKEALQVMEGLRNDIRSKLWRDVILNLISPNNEGVQPISLCIKEANKVLKEYDRHFDNSNKGTPYNLTDTGDLIG